MSVFHEIENCTTWEAFVSRQPNASFLQSWYWGEVHKQSGRSVRRLAYMSGNRICAAAQLILMTGRLGSSLYIPYGPVLDWQDTALADRVLSELLKIAREVGVDYLRIDPRISFFPSIGDLLKDNGFRKAAGFVQAEFDWVLDLERERSDEELLGAMRSTTRQRIKQSIKIGVEVTKSVNHQDFDTFYHLLEETAKRQGFVPQNRTYLTKQFEILSGAGIAELFVARYLGEPLAASIVMFYGDNASYVHGASVANSGVPANHLLQWEAIKESKRRGIRVYDFWGISPNDDPDHPLAGVTEFKQGFGGRRVNYIGAWDASTNMKYYLTRWVEKYRKFRSGF
jgi:lipid II:glycine glycyltransferase (peptidoglycan interpeptide bridge formation enzyme)